MADNIPKYRQIAKDLRTRIDSGELAPGTQLPTEKELADLWDVSPNTIKKALNELRMDGRVETVPQTGSFVTEADQPFVITLNHTELDDERAPGPRYGSGEGRAFEIEARRQRHEAQFSKPEVQVEDAEDFHMKAFGIPPVPEGQLKPQIVRRSQRRLVDGKPNSLQHSYYRLELAIEAQLLLNSADIVEGTVAYLQSCGHVQAGYEDVFNARPPTAEERKFFRLSKDSLAVMEHIRTAYDQNGEPIRLTITAYKPGATLIRFIAGEVPDEVWQKGSS
ncbi:GntR family transcriptional regulator [Actinomadura sp. KC06]|uniref:GntR family transcriptional regulator n=1 Tax=Actinomadura sp. KC06 TaxID=2530369 RepID=UPI0010540F39|nr:GntR family transcriptional regulator [Actinomadura sp. KC06]TDD37407.1 GntR family transcriptional regulator [Actinomadura sp. KC06]